MSPNTLYRTLSVCLVHRGSTDDLLCFRFSVMIIVIMIYFYFLEDGVLSKCNYLFVPLQLKQYEYLHNIYMYMTYSENKIRKPIMQIEYYSYFPNFF